MNDSEIIEIIQDFHKEFAYEDKVSGTSKYTFLSLYIKRQPSDVQQAFIDFCLREIENNNHGLIYDTIAILRCLNDKQIIPKLFEIFVEHYKNNKDCKNIFLLLMRLEDTDHAHVVIYKNYVHQQLAKNVAYNFAYIIDYIAINTNDALCILSDFYIDVLKNKSITWNQMYVFTLAVFFMKRERKPLVQLLKMIYSKSQPTGIYLQKLFMEFAKYHSVENKEEWNNLQNMILELNTISLSE